MSNPTPPHGPLQAPPIVGVRHTHHERGCFCGCKAVAGLTGYIVQDADTPKLATLGVLIAEFPDVPYHHGPMRIAYDYADLGLIKCPSGCEPHTCSGKWTESNVTVCGLCMGRGYAGSPRA